ncbi:two-partner secretion domain-containing protein [Mastigocladopsis repens]|uniref:two-partner secretion domain-containing protein n=1 Tax=Mastigocladopsis repens TaxID=221287 RepID=UPI000307224B|nr:filamentous hemagglutinin N-terminal domain-containing protein [Mastigocladopsis repens]
MKQGCRSLFLITLPLCTLGSLAPITHLKAQISGDGTVSTTVTTPDGSNFNINDGTTRGGNLFHSFKEFSVPTGGSAVFNNATDIQNIISRVTGGSVSSIDGLIKANGTANLFLLNPAGIIFGPNASLNIGGSFLASTANSLLFDNGFEFSATNPQAPPLLTVNIPIGLRFRDNPGTITTQSANLEVASGNSLTLVGGDVNLDGGSLQAFNGRIELAGVAGTGTVGLLNTSNNINLNYPDNLQRADVSLGNAAKVDVTGRGAGNVVVTAGNLDISGQSSISAGIAQGLTADSQQPGDVNLDLTGTLKVNQDSRVNNVINTRATGKAGNIDVKATTVDINGGILRTRTLGNGDAGDINIQAGDIFIDNPAYQLPGRNVTLDDKPALDASNYSSDNSSRIGRGRSGNISLTASGSISLIGRGRDIENKVISIYNARGGKGGGSISLQADKSISLSNAYLVSSTFSQDSKAGDISLKGNESISLTNNSGINAVSFNGGNSGNLTLESQGSVSLQTSTLSAEVRGLNRQNPARGNAGKIQIIGRSISITDKSFVTTKSNNAGNPGNIAIIASDFVEISGKDKFSSQTNRRRQEAKQTTLQTSSDDRAQGQGGDINITTATLHISDGAKLEAETFSKSPGGNIFLQVRDLIFRGENNLISAKASSNANGGNITINAPDGFIVAFPKENNDIIANASAGQGGNIQVITQAIFGMTEGQAIPGNRTNDIDASSQFGVAGTVSINTPDINPNQGLIELPETVIDPTQQIAQNPCHRGVGSSFVITGRGGLPSNPNQLLSSDNVRVDLVKPVASTLNSISATVNQLSTSPSVKKIVPAHGWIFNEKGEVVLTAYVPTNTTSQRSQQTPAICAAR